MRNKLNQSFNQALIACEQQIFCNGLYQFLEHLGAAMNIRKANCEKDYDKQLKGTHKFDLIVLVSPFFKRNGFKTLEKIYTHQSRCSIIIMADEHEMRLVLSLVKEGVKVIISKNATEAELVQALNHAATKSFYFSAVFSEAVINKSLQSFSRRERTGSLPVSEREKEIIRLMWNDCTSKEIAESLHISLRTVETHRKNIYDKLNVKTLGGIFRFGIEEGIIQA